MSGGQRTTPVSSRFHDAQFLVQANAVTRVACLLEIEDAARAALDHCKREHFLDAERVLREALDGRG